MEEGKHLQQPVKTPMAFMDKLFIFLLLVSVFYVAFLYFQESIMGLLKMNPYVWAFFSHIFDEISRNTLLGLFYASLFGSLFFIFLPIELLFLYYLTLGYPVPIIMALTIIGSVIGLIIDYLFGFAFGARLIKYVFGGKFDRFHNLVSRWGSAIIFLGNIIPSPIQPASVVIGSARYSFIKFLVFTSIGNFVKVFALVVIGMYISGNI